MLIKVASCRAIALWDDTLEEAESIRTAGQAPSSPRHPIMSFIGWGVPLSGHPGHASRARAPKTPGFQRLGSTAGSVAGSYYSGPPDSSRVQISSPSSIILPSIIAPSSAYDPRLSQGPSSRLGSGSDSSAQGDCYDPDAQRISALDHGLG